MEKVQMSTVYGYCKDSKFISKYDFEYINSELMKIYYRHDNMGKTAFGEKHNYYSRNVVRMRTIYVK